MEKEKIICDVDTGIDDAVAIALALNAGNLDLKLITTCAGNTTVENVTHNTLTILNWFKRGDVPVAQGAQKPLKRERLKLSVHGGATGMGEYPFESHNLKKCRKGAVEKMYEVIKKEKNITIICTAPVTNLATLIKKHPDIVKYIKRVIVQSGLLTDEDYNSFNVYSDPEAMEIVINSGIPLMICPSDMGHVTCLTDEETQRARELNKTGEMFATIFEYFRDRVCKERVAMHDSCAVACVSNPDLFAIAPAKCSVVSREDGTKKFKIEFGVKPNCDCCTKVDVQGFKEYMFNNLSKCK